MKISMQLEFDSEKDLKKPVTLHGVIPIQESEPLSDIGKAHIAKVVDEREAAEIRKEQESLHSYEVAVQMGVQVFQQWSVKKRVELERRTEDLKKRAAASYDDESTGGKS